MDTLVARYSQPMFEKDFSQEDQLEQYQQAPGLSLRFAMPPVAQVCISLLFPSNYGTLVMIRDVC